MEKKVTTIPATLNRFTSASVVAATKRKVAGYARVSTDLEEQQSSYEAQMDYYKNYITSRSDWEFVDMYSDEGITATSTKFRAGFKRMVEDALAGKIDLIITKSISRFARNTVDSLTTIRQLKENGVEVYFEKENIWTFDAKGELLITIMSSLAQEESRSISENTTWGKRKAFADGKVSVAFSHFLGYDKGFVINEEEAVTVRMIYKYFLMGYSMSAIKKELEKRERLTATGNKHWTVSAIESVLTNEKYRGDALLQKTFTTDFLTKAKKKNEGELAQYHITGHHEPIVDPAIYDAVQVELRKRAKAGRYLCGKNAYAAKIRCGDCGIATSGAVDMGTSVKWAAYNLGATKPEEYGDYYAWGETQTKSNYRWSTYRWCNGDYNKLTKYCPTDKTDYWDGEGTPDGKAVLDLEDDAARANWSGTWRMPTDEEWTELRESCAWEWTNLESTNGYKVYCFESGNSIFLPAAGFRVNYELSSVGSTGDYWSSSLYTGDPDSARRLYFTSDNFYRGYSDRLHGFSIRSVSE